MVLLSSVTPSVSAVIDTFYTWCLWCWCRMLLLVYMVLLSRVTPHIYGVVVKCYPWCLWLCCQELHLVLLLSVTLGVCGCVVKSYTWCCWWCYSLLIQLRCQVHMEVSKCEEDEEQIQVALEHLTKVCRHGNTFITLRT